MDRQKSFLMHKCYYTKNKLYWHSEAIDILLISFKSYKNATLYYKTLKAI